MHQKTPKQLVNSGLKFQALEPRIMFDGAAVFTGAEALDQIENQNTSQIQNDINQSNYAPLLNWLTSNIHTHGRRYTRNELLERSTGETLNPLPYINYLKGKASQVYGVKFND